MSIQVTKNQMIEDIAELLQGEESETVAEIYGLISGNRTAKPQGEEEFEVTDCESVIQLFTGESAYNFFNVDTHFDHNGQPIIPCTFEEARESLDHGNKGVFNAYWRSQARTLNALFAKNELTFQDMIFDPLEEEEIKIRVDEAGYISGVIFVDLNDMSDIDALNDIAEGKMVESGILADISYKSLFIFGSTVLLYVNAQVESIFD